MDGINASRSEHRRIPLHVHRGTRIRDVAGTRISNKTEREIPRPLLVGGAMELWCCMTVGASRRLKHPERMRGLAEA